MSSPPAATLVEASVKLQALEQQIHRSERELASLQSQPHSALRYIDDRDRPYDTHPDIQARRVEQKLTDLVRIYAKMSCRNIFDTMQTKLPRELRDLVYEYLFDKKVVKVGPGSGCLSCGLPYHSARKTCSNCEGNPVMVESTPSTGMPYHLTETKYVGTLSLREMAKRWYEISNFLIELPRSFGTLLDQDIWKTGLDPRESVRYVTLKICLCDLLDIKSALLGESQLYFNSVLVAQLVGTLKQMLRFKEGINTKIVFEVGCEFKSEGNKKALSRSLQPCFEVLKGLQDYGHHLRILFVISHFMMFPGQVCVTVHDWEAVMKGLKLSDLGWVEVGADDSDDDVEEEDNGCFGWSSEEEHFDSNASEESDDGYDIVI